jgi:hypothetical protein
MASSLFYPGDEINVVTEITDRPLFGGVVTSGRPTFWTNPGEPSGRRAGRPLAPALAQSNRAVLAQTASPVRA